MRNSLNYPDRDKEDRDNSVWLKFLLLDAEQVLLIGERLVGPSDEQVEREQLLESKRFSLPEIETILFQRKHRVNL